MTKYTITRITIYRPTYCCSEDKPLPSITH